ncbi:hypothetical protein IAU60_000132 [Kwoniella sp. DSM 27419]
MAAIAPLPRTDGSLTLKDNSILHQMLSNPLTFGEPVPRNSYKFDVKMKEVMPGPSSPPPSFRRIPLVNGNGKERKDGQNQAANPTQKAKPNGHGATSAPPSPAASSSKIPTTPATVSAQAPAPSPSTVTSQPTPASKIAELTPRPSRVADTSSTDLYSADVDLRWPDHLAGYKKPAAGLYNPSMACYANATLQVLLHTPPVLRIALAHQEDQCLRHKKNLFCMLCQLRDMAAGQHWERAKRYAPSVHGNLKHIKKGFSKNKQEDTHEFFRFVTDGLQATALAGYPKDTPEKIKHTSWVYRVWGGKVRSRVVCSRCNKPSDTFDWFLDLSLDVNKGGKKSIASMMSGFTKEDRLEGDNKYHCDNCKAKANATKSFKIEQAPPILTLHLKRFSVNYNAYSGRARAEKFNSFIEYPEHLDIAPYMVNGKAGGSKYRLFGVTCHRGAELRFGHYTSYVKGPQGAWFQADDDDVSPVSLREVLGDKTAYLLSYIRVPDGSVPTPLGTPSKLRNGTLANGNESSPSANGHKRSRSDDSDEEEEELENVLQPKRNGVVGPQQPMTIRKATPPPARKAEANSKGEGSESEEDEGEIPPEIPVKRFGSEMKSSKKLYQPTPIPPSRFYGAQADSPIARPRGPVPSSPSSSMRMSKKERKKLMKAEKKKKRSGASPYGAAKLSSQPSNWRKGAVNRMGRK